MFTLLIPSIDLRISADKLVAGGTAPALQQLIPRFTKYHPNVKRAKVRYGPYKLPSVDSLGAMALLTGEKGTMATIAFAMRKPCEGQCNLVMAQAGLEYANGSVADNSNGAWLHHIVMLATGSGRKDNICGTWILPGERFFSSGNEQTPTTFGDAVGVKVKSVFPLTSGDTFSSQLELMNLDRVEKTVYLTIDWEYIAGPRPADFKIAKAMWLDVTGCGISSAFAPAGRTSFTLTMTPWTATFSGEMLGVGTLSLNAFVTHFTLITAILGGHLHDGGTHVNVYRNGQVICNSKAVYGKDGGDHAHGGKKTLFVNGTSFERRNQPGISNDGKNHIVKMGTCALMGPIKRGDRINIDANYDYKQYDKAPGAVMGIAILYAAADPGSMG